VVELGKYSAGRLGAIRLTGPGAVAIAAVRGRGRRRYDRSGQDQYLV